MLYAINCNFFCLQALDFRNVEFVYGGFPKQFSTASAMVIDETVYLEDGLCPSEGFFIRLNYLVGLCYNSCLRPTGA